ncbi:hypothetical protein M0R45_029877 [Rubus argutus]|uniref:Uncharacterized protein n=1 Tax=Rubus argutus TaxID=59490 RepID=A0AAW1WBX8_RUBAR
MSLSPWWISTAEINSDGRSWCDRTTAVGVVVAARSGKESEKKEKAPSGEGGDDLAETWRGGGGPRGVADVGPEALLGGERAELGGGAGGGGKSGAVEAAEDVSLNYVRMDGGD